MRPEWSGFEVFETGPMALRTLEKCCIQWPVSSQSSLSRSLVLSQPLILQNQLVSWGCRRMLPPPPLCRSLLEDNNLFGTREGLAAANAEVSPSPCPISACSLTPNTCGVGTVATCCGCSQMDRNLQLAMPPCPVTAPGFHLAPAPDYADSRTQPCWFKGLGSCHP